MIGKNYIFLAGKETGRKRNPKNDRMMSRQIRQLAGQLLNCCPVYSTSFQLCRSLWRLLSLRILDSCFKSHPSCQLFRPLRVFLETLDNLPLEGTIVIDLNLSGEAEMMALKGHSLPRKLHIRLAHQFSSFKKKVSFPTWLALSREWGNQPLRWYIGDSFPHSLLRAS